jgi:hypothetical protein
VAQHAIQPAQNVRRMPITEVRLQRDDRILPETRLVAGLVIVVLLLAFTILYVFPTHTGTNFAWAVAPPLTPMLIGAGYMAGAYFFLRVLTGKAWHRVALGYLPITAFTIIMLAATVLHWDRFRHGSFEFYLWTVIYIVTPFLVPLLWWRNRQTDTGKPEELDYILNRSVRLTLAAIAIGGAVFSLFLFARPDWAIAVAPWKLTALTARVGSGWILLGSLTVLSAVSDGRWSSVRILIQSAVIGGILMFFAIVRGWNELNQANPLTWITAAAMALSVVALSAIHLALDARRHA